MTTTVDETAAGRTCCARKKDGSPCQSWAGAGSAFCITHDPARAAQLAEARRKGGRARHGRNVGSVGAQAPVNLASPNDVLNLLTEAVNEVRGMEASINKARAVGYLASVWADCYETSELERRVAALEAAQHGKAD